MDTPSALLKRKRAEIKLNIKAGLLPDGKFSKEILTMYDEAIVLLNKSNL